MGKPSQKLDIERADLPHMLGEQGGLRGIELGVASGDFSARLWQSGCFRELWGVDAYADRHDTGEYIAAVKAIGFDANYRLIRSFFSEALDLFPDGYFDFIYVDGYAHTGEEAGRTLYDWYAKLRVGGMIAGHDYHEEWPLVVENVDRFAADAGLDLMVTRLTTNPGPQDLHPSWAAFRRSGMIVEYPPELNLLFKRQKRRERLRAWRRRWRQTAKPVEPNHAIRSVGSPKWVLKGLRRKLRRRLYQVDHAHLGGMNNSRKGERCLILGSAPSISKLDLSQIRRCDIFALNKASIACDNIEASKKYLIVADPKAAQEADVRQRFSSFDAVFLSSDAVVDDPENCIRFDLYGKPKIDDGFAQDDLTRPLFDTHTVAGVAVQVAVAMGYKRIYLAGIDLTFDSREPYFYRESASEAYRLKFISDVRVSKMRAALAFLAKWASERGVKVVNLSPMKSLPLLETAEFADIFGESTRAE